MKTIEDRRFRIESKVISASELVSKDMPPIEFLWGDLLRPKGKLALVGAPKSMKSFFAIQLGINLALGIPFLGMETKQSRVLYINFEISEEKLQARLRDICESLDLKPPENLLLSTRNGLSLDKSEGLSQLKSLCEESGAALGGLDIIIIDPRRQAMEGDENQSEILSAWCKNVDRIATSFGSASVIVHHTGKSTTGAGRGSSVFDAWLDTIIILEGGLTPILKIQARDSDISGLSVLFKYPNWHLTEKQETKDRSKVDEACVSIVKILRDNQSGPYGHPTLRLKTLQSGHSEYAYKQAMKRLQEVKKIELTKDKSKGGNHKLVNLVPPD